MKGQTSTSALKRFMNKDNTVGHVFAFPFIFGFVCFSLIPVCISFYYAFTNYSLGSKTAAFIGFKNFLRLFQDEVVDNYRNYIQQVVDGQITAEEAAQKTYDDAAALFTK